MEMTTITYTDDEGVVHYIDNADLKARYSHFYIYLSSVYCILLWIVQFPLTESKTRCFFILSNKFKFMFS